MVHCRFRRVWRRLSLPRILALARGKYALLSLVKTLLTENRFFLCQFHVQDFATFGEMLLTGLMEANKRFEEMESEFRFVENVELGEEVYDVFMAKKKTGKPKDGEPSKYNKLNQILKSETFQS